MGRSSERGGLLLAAPLRQAGIVRIITVHKEGPSKTRLFAMLRRCASDFPWWQQFTGHEIGSMAELIRRACPRSERKMRPGAFHIVQAAFQRKSIIERP